MLLSYFLAVAATLPLGFAHDTVVTEYICDPSYTDGYTLAPQPTYAAGDGSGDGGYGNGGNGGSGTKTYGGHAHTHAHGSNSTHTHGHGSHTSTLITKTTATSTKPATTKTVSTYVPGCTNTADDRTKWCGGYSIDSNLDTEWPTTGKTRQYLLEVTNTTMAPDGFERLVLAINGQYPGPTIEADWGDMLEITVKNSLQNNGTSMHWHGIRQLNSNTMDGTNGITECPIPPGQSKTYKFLATQHGTSWYHSHYSAQYGDGVVGQILIHGPATANYDEDLGTYPITEWYHTTVYQNSLYSTYNGGSSPIADNGLINGKMKSPDGKSGAYSKTTLVKGKKYRLRLINESVDNHFKVSLDGHPFQVITSDFVPIVPYTTEWVFLAIGQRYDVIITADQATSNYWFRAEAMLACSAPNNNNGNIKAIFSYEGAKDADPTSTASDKVENCVDEQTLVPRVSKDVPSADFVATVESLTAGLGSGVDTQGNQVVRWTINGVPISIDWDQPTLQYVADKTTTFPDKLNVVKMPNKGQWYYWIIQATDVPNAHPIHLHGHDFSLLGTGGGTFDNSQVSSLNFKNPPRRDVAMMPSAGWLAIAFEADNPGAWLMHCHIAWHVAQGFAAQFLEQEDAIATTVDLSVLKDTCDSWTAYQKGMPYPQDDSGL